MPGVKVEDAPLDRPHEMARVLEPWGLSDSVSKSGIETIDREADGKDRYWPMSAIVAEARNGPEADILNGQCQTLLPVEWRDAIARRR